MSDLTDEQWDALMAIREWIDKLRPSVTENLADDDMSAFGALLALRPVPERPWHPGDRWALLDGEHEVMVSEFEDRARRRLCVEWWGPSQREGVPGWSANWWAHYDQLTTTDEPESWVEAGRPGATESVDEQQEWLDSHLDPPCPEPVQQEVVSISNLPDPVGDSPDQQIASDASESDLSTSCELSSRGSAGVGRSPDWDTIARDMHDQGGIIVNDRLSLAAAVEAVVGPLLAEKDETFRHMEISNRKLSDENHRAWTICAKLEDETPDWWTPDTMAQVGDERFVLLQLYGGHPDPLSQIQVAVRARPEGDSNE